MSSSLSPPRLSGFHPLYSSTVTVLVKITSDFSLPNIIISSWFSIHLTWQHHWKQQITSFFETLVALDSSTHIPLVILITENLLSFFARFSLMPWLSNALVSPWIYWLLYLWFFPQWFCSDSWLYMPSTCQWLPNLYFWSEPLHWNPGLYIPTWLIWHLSLNI